MTDAPPAGTYTWHGLLDEATQRFEEAGLESPAVDARWIVEEAAGVEPGELVDILAAPATVRGIARFDAMMWRRIDGEPLQYVLGRWGFRTLDLAVDRRALVPRPETEVVAGLAIDEVAALAAAREGDVIVVDLGTGSGAIALAVVVECSRARVLATDRSPDALALARANVAGTGLAGARVSIHEGSWYDALPEAVLGAVDVIVANPPYIADDEVLPDVVANWEPQSALRAGPSGTEALEAIVVGAARWLAPDGSVVLEMAPHQTGVIADLLARAGFAATIHEDLAGRERAVVGRRRR